MRRKLKILVIFTGGTIGSSLTGDYISPDKSKGYKLLDLFRQGDMCDIEFETLQPYTILSETLSGEYISRLGKCVEENALYGYDGVVITHGTDTVQYMAAGISYHFPNVDIPIMIVSSNHILEDPRANGLDNFSAAVRFICAEEGNGVFVPYRNSDNITYVHRGTRLLRHLPYSDDLFSIGGLIYGKYEQGNSTFMRAESEVKGKSLDQECLALPLPTTDISDILRLYPYPGMSYPRIELLDVNQLPKAILLDTYHSGTLGSPSNAAEFFSCAKANAIPVFMTGANDEPDYASIASLADAGVVRLPQASPIAMYMKLWMTLSGGSSLDARRISDILKAPIAHDVVPYGMRGPNPV